MVRFRQLTGASPSSSSSSSVPRLSRLAAVLSGLSATLCLVIHHAYSRTQPAYPPGSLSEGARGGGAGSCRMSFMSPSYLHLSGFGREFTRLGNGPWGLYLYREAGWDADPLPDPSSPGAKDDKLHLHGTPVLFVPGNAGSFRQVRSLAAAVSRTWFEQPGVPRRSVAGRGNGAAPLDFFTLDFNDDFSAFHGQTLLDQAEYTADCVRYILSLYAHHEEHPEHAARPDPTSVIIVAHSMGGIVARAAILNKNYQAGSISTLVTFATPHFVPPVTVDAGVDRVYRAINDYWREAYGLAPPSSSFIAASAATEVVPFPSSSHSFRRPPAEELASLVLISLSGGLSDLTIASESVSLLSLLPPSSSHGFTAFTTAIPGVQTPIDHLAILWCQQLMYSVAEGLLAIVDVRRSEGVVPREERVKVLAKRWLGTDSVEEEGTTPSRKLESVLRGVEQEQQEHLRVGERLVARPSGSKRSAFVVPIPPSRTYSGSRVFSLLTNGRIGRKKGEAVEVYACTAISSSSSLHSGDEDDEAASSRAETMEDEPDCIPLATGRTTRLPASPHSDVSPVLPVQITDEGEGMSLLEIEAEDAALKAMKVVVVLVKREKAEGRGVWVVVEWAEKERRRKVVDEGHFHLLFSPYKVSLPVASLSSAATSTGESRTSPAALISELWVPALDTSLLTLRARVWRGSCHDSTALFAPLLRQTSPLLHEAKTFPNVRQASLYTHSGGPFLPPPASSTSPSAQSGALLQFFLDPTCTAGEGEVVVEIEVDWWATLGSIVVRYRMAMVTVPFAVVMLVLARQLREYDSGNSFPSFGTSLSLFTRCNFPALLLGLLLLSYAQSVLLTSHHSTHSSHPHAHSADALPPSWISDALLGNAGAAWAPLAPLVAFAMLAVVVGVWVVVWALVAGMAGATRLLQRRGSAGMKAWLIVTEPRETLPLQRVLTMAVLLLVVLLFAPYQFAFLVLVLVHLFTTARFLLLAWDGSAPPSYSATSSSSASTATPPRSAALTTAASRRLWTRYHYSFSILLVLVTLIPINALILVVWVRNLAVGWLAPFSSDHNVLLLVGFLANIEAVHGGRVLQPSGKSARGSTSLTSLATSLLLSAPALYSFIYGIRSAHRLYPLANLAMLWLAARTSRSVFSSTSPAAEGGAADLAGAGAVGGTGKRRTSVPPEPVVDLTAGLTDVVQGGAGGVQRKVASIGGEGAGLRKTYPSPPFGSSSSMSFSTPSRRTAHVVGVGMTKFDKPRNLRDYPELALEAATKALLDAGITYDEVQQAAVGYVYGDSTCGQRALYQLGMTGIPIVNVNNNCSTGSSALWLARQAVEYGIADCAMALGFEKMSPGSLQTVFQDRAAPLAKTVDLMSDMDKFSHGPFAAQIFGNAAAEYIEKHGATWDDVADIAAKSHTHSKANPYAQFHEPKTREEVLKDKKITNELTRSMCCPTSDGAACAIVCSESFVRSHGLENQAIEIAAQASTTDSPKLYSRSGIELAGADMTRRAAREVWEKSGVKPEDVQVIELHDCFAANELVTYDALGLVPEGKAHELVRSKDFTYGGKWVINPSGGLLAKGHPLGATGLGMTTYCVWQLRGWAGGMQDPRCAPGVKEKEGKKAYALAHNLGLGGSCVVTLFSRPTFFSLIGARKEDGRVRLGYNPGEECRGITADYVEKVKSRVASSRWAEAKL
ncbi:hypothetical protein JCM8547_001663 [Rhodosporidiobolus lusitaniae]